MQESEMMFHEEKFINVDNGKLFCSIYEKDSKNSPALIAMHGGPGLGHNYLLPQMAQLQKFSSVVFYDQRGTGKSRSDAGWQANPFNNRAWHE